MSYRNNRNFDRNNYGGSISRNVDPWDTSNDWGMQRGGGGGSGGNYNQSSQSNDALAFANNLISNLLRSNNHQQPPSLLDLPQSDMRGGYGGGGGGGGYGRGNNSGDFDRFDDRRMGGGGGGGGGNNRNRNNNNNRRGGGGGGPRNNNKPNNKGGGIRKPNSIDRSKKILAKNSNNSKPTPKTEDAGITNQNPDLSQDEHNEDGGVEGSDIDSLYTDVPSEMFYCHLCKKHMWDCTSFENHIKGRTHQMMKEGVEESYRLKANMIRQEAKIDEQLKSIEVERLKRIGKNMKASNIHREYCTMCDLHFYGHLSTHRKSEGHLNLKRFLHPKCTDCNKEFPTRIEFDAHLLARDHMIKAALKTNRNETRRKNQLVILTETDETKDLRDEKEEKKKEKAEKMETENSAEGATTENAEGATETAVEGEKKEDEEGKAEEPVEVESADVILDYVEGETEIGPEVETKIPKYLSTRPIATSLIGKLECYECKLCNRYFDSEQTAEIHSRTVYHHRQFAKFLTEKANETKIAQKRAAASVENEKKKQARLEKEATNGTDEAAAEGKTTTNGDVKVTVEGEESELYDPCHATEEDDEKLGEDQVMADEKNEAPAAKAGEEEAVGADVQMDDVKKEVEKPATVQKTTPVAQKPQAQNKQTTPNRGRGGNRGSPGGRGGRGRGRYNRF